MLIRYILPAPCSNRHTAIHCSCNNDRLVTKRGTLPIDAELFLQYADPPNSLITIQRWNDEYRFVHKMALYQSVYLP